MNVDESLVSVHDDGLGDGVGECCPLCVDVQNVAGGKWVNHDENDEGSCVDEVIEKVW